MRGFIGIPLPAQTRRSLHQALVALRDHYPGLKWVDEQNYHITMLFLGDIDEEETGRITRLLDSLPRIPQWSVKIDRIAQFPRKGPPRVVVAELESGEEECRRVFEVVAGLLPEYTERRRYIPHVTLARTRRGGGAVPGRKDYPGLHVDFTAEALALFESVLAPTGAVYRPEHQIDFI